MSVTCLINPIHWLSGIDCHQQRIRWICVWLSNLWLLVIPVVLWLLHVTRTFRSCLVSLMLPCHLELVCKPHNIPRPDCTLPSIQCLTDVSWFLFPISHFPLSTKNATTTAKTPLTNTKSASAACSASSLCQSLKGLVTSKLCAPFAISYDKTESEKSKHASWSTSSRNSPCWLTA